MHRLVFLCDWLPPDFGAVGQYSLARARERAAAGEEVTLIGLSSTGAGREEVRLGLGRLEVRRIHAATYDRSAFARRLLWTARTNLRLLGAAWPSLRQADEVLFTGSPPFLLHFVIPLAALFPGLRTTYRITDFHPECLIAELGRSPWWLRAFHALTLALRRRVDRFEVLGEDQRARLLENGIAASRITLRRDPAPVEVTPDTAPLPLPDGLVEVMRQVEAAAVERTSTAGAARLLLYSGNFGVAHDHQTLIDAYRLHHREGPGRVLLWLNATGAKADLVEAALREEGLPVYRSRPVPLAELARLLVTPAAHLITLRDPFVGYVLPSKVYGCVASGKPVIFVGSAASDVDLICRGEGGGVYRRVGTGDHLPLAVVLAELADGGLDAENTR